MIKLIKYFLIFSAFTLTTIASANPNQLLWDAIKRQDWPEVKRLIAEEPTISMHFSGEPENEDRTHRKCIGELLADAGQWEIISSCAKAPAGKSFRPHVFHKVSDARQWDLLGLLFDQALERRQRNAAGRSKAITLWTPPKKEAIEWAIERYEDDFDPNLEIKNKYSFLSYAAINKNWDLFGKMLKILDRWRTKPDFEAVADGRPNIIEHIAMAGNWDLVDQLVQSYPIPQMSLDFVFRAALANRGSIVQHVLRQQPDLNIHAFGSLPQANGRNLLTVLADQNDWQSISFIESNMPQTKLSQLVIERAMAAQEWDLCSRLLAKDPKHFGPSFVDSFSRGKRPPDSLIKLAILERAIYPTCFVQLEKVLDKRARAVRNRICPLFENVASTLLSPNFHLTVSPFAILHSDLRKMVAQTIVKMQDPNLAELDPFVLRKALDGFCGQYQDNLVCRSAEIVAAGTTFARYGAPHKRDAADLEARMSKLNTKYLRNVIIEIVKEAFRHPEIRSDPTFAVRQNLIAELSRLPLLTRAAIAEVVWQILQLPPPREILAEVAPKVDEGFEGESDLKRLKAADDI